MATSLETTSLSSPDKSLSRKRKQDFSTSSSSSSLAGWTDYLYSSPSSPSTSMSTTAEANPLTHHQPHHQDSSSGCDFNFDSIFGQSLDHVTCTFDFGGIDHMQQQQSSSSGSTSRRHSVAVGEIDYHSFPAAVKQEFRYDTDLQQLLGLPSSWSSSESSSVTPENVAPHKRTMSLRLETNHSAYNQQQQPASPTTPNFFSPGFLDALNADEDKDTVFTFPTDTSFTTQSLAFMDQQQQQDFIGVSPSPSSSSVDAFLHHHNQGTAEQQQQQQQRGGLVPTNTIAPSAISSNNMNGGGWMTDRRHAKSRLSPPTSPSNNTISSSSPSPPVTPMQAVGYDSHTFKHPAIPEEDEEMTSAPQEKGRRQSSERSSSLLHDDHVMSSNAMRATTTTKGGLVAARMQLGASTAATLKPHIRNYLLSNDPAGSGERTVMILTSKVAQKSYGTEKRFLCPPPSTVLIGASWWTSDCTHSSSDCNTNSSFYSSSTPLAPPKLTVNISGEQTIQNGNIEWYTSTGALLDGSAAAAAAAAGDTAVTGKCVSKHLHINDADEKRKRVEVRVQMQLGNGVHLGTLASKGIKVISKPSKKRQSVKNMELCIHHGTTISLFNRIRSQTVSTKYLGVSTSGQQGSKGGNNNNNNNNANGTCFVARTGSWDPFVIWIVDTSRAPDIASISRKHHPTNPHYPPPPAIALQTDPSQQPMAIHYNQAVVLQCVTTGLVSPVMVIRKVDKGSMVLGGSKVFDDIACTTGTGAGGECGDECLGDPVSQLHKVAFQIVQDPSMAHSNKAAGNFSSRQDNFTNGWTLPQSCQPITYLACLNDVVGMHKTATARTFISQPPDVSDWSSSSDYVVSQESAGGKVVRKRRVSCDVVKPNSLPAKLQQQQLGRRRVNSVTDVPITRRGSTCSALSDHRRSSTDSNAFLGDGACWTEDVSDAAIWTIVGTDCATYTFWTPSPFVTGETIFNSPFTASSNLPQDPTTSSPITPFPVIAQISPGGAAGGRLLISGEGFSRDLAVWFGDVKAPLTEYKARDSLACAVPDIHELLSSPVTTIDQEDGQKKLPILLVRGDGVVYQTGRFYSF